MKNKHLFPLIVLLIAGVVFSSCSKDSSIMTPQQANDQTTTSLQKFNQDYSGSISGVLFPAPTNAVIIVYVDKNVIANTTSNEKGAFILENLPEGIYTMKISYSPSNADSDAYRTLLIENIKVSERNNTDLGIIKLK